MDYKSIRDFDLKDKHVLLRADLNVPSQDGKPTDTTRIDRLKNSIDQLRKAGAKILIISHFGRPKGTPNPEMSLAFLTPALEERWGASVQFVPACIGEEAENAANNLAPGDIALLENLRFHEGEEANDQGFASELAKLADIYINDAFSASHRAHASTEAIAHLLPTAAGPLMEEELNALDQALGHPQKPVAAITGGSKISTKLNVLNNLIKKVDYLVLGGAMANTFLHAKGINIGQSLCEKDMAQEAQKIMDAAESNNCEIILPRDVVTVKELKENAEHKTLPCEQIPEDEWAVDTGPEAAAYILEKIKNCKTVVWNGPLGVFETKPFDQGTNTVAQGVADLTKSEQLISIAGGGDTAAALENAGVSQDFTYISTAGGAFFEWLEGKTLPGVAALSAFHQAA